MIEETGTLSSEPFRNLLENNSIKIDILHKLIAAYDENISMYSADTFQFKDS